MVVYRSGRTFQERFLRNVIAFDQECMMKSCTVNLDLLKERLCHVQSNALLMLSCWPRDISDHEDKVPRCEILLVNTAPIMTLTIFVSLASENSSRPLHVDIFFTEEDSCFQAVSGPKPIEGPNSFEIQQSS